MNVDSSLQQREVDRRPIRVALIGAGATGRAIALQLATPVPGIRLAGICNRTPGRGERALREAGVATWTTAVTAVGVERGISSGTPVITNDPSLLVRSDAVDLVIEVTGSVVPLALMMGIFFTKYVVAVQLAMHPHLAHQTDVALVVGSLYGAFSGIFAARGIRLWMRALRPGSRGGAVVRSAAPA